MGKSLPPPAAIDLVGSFARRRGPDVEVVLSDPKLDLTGGDLVLALAQGTRTVTAPAQLLDDPSGRRLIAHTPRAGLRDGPWTLTLRSGPADPEPVDARLLVQGARPLVLLWKTRGQRSLQPAGRVDSSRKRRAAVQAGAALDRVLTVVPNKAATRIRTRARAVGRRVLGSGGH